MIVITALGWLIVTFFVVGGVINCAGSTGIRAGFERWGYPPYMHLITGALELLSALLMAVPATRLPGQALALGVMMAALATVLRHRDYRHAVPPALTIVALVAWGTLSIGYPK